jgi:hypothetical protein
MMSEEKMKDDEAQQRGHDAPAARDQRDERRADDEMVVLQFLERPRRRAKPRDQTSGEPRAR